MQALTCVYKASVRVIFTELYVHISKKLWRKDLRRKCYFMQNTSQNNDNHANENKNYYKTVYLKYINSKFYTLQQFFHGIFIFSFILTLRSWNIIITSMKYLLLLTEETSTGSVLFSFWEDEAWHVQVVPLVGWVGCCPWFQKHSDSWTWSKARQEYWQYWWSIETRNHTGKILECFSIQS